MTSLALFTTSPQRADPLTWMISFNLPLLAAFASGAGGVVIAVVMGQRGASAAAIVIATVLSVLGCLVVLRAAQPQRPDFRPVQALLPMGFGVASMVVSAVGHRESGIPITDWTGSLGLCTVMIALVPYCSAFVFSLCGVVGGVLAAVVARWAFPEPIGGEWTLFIVGATMPLHVGIVGAAFSGMVVASVVRWRALPYDREELAERPVAFASRLREHGTPVAISDEVIALLSKVADGGRVTAKERTDAAELAAGIRADLVTTLDRSWLDTIAPNHRLTVEDPQNVANRMTRQQRAAIHALIRAALDSPVIDGEGLRIELRGLDDGTTAVALSMDLNLPEGKRVMMLAPYFVSLKASVHDLEWAGGEQLRMRFKLPAPPDHTGR